MILLTLSSFGQQEYTLHFNRNLPQSMNSNPAFKNPYKFNLMLPSVAFNFGNNSFTYRDLVKQHPTYDSTYLDIDGVIDQMAEENILQLQSEVEVLAVYFTYKSWFFTLSTSEKFDIRFKYPKDLIDLIWNGNAKFIGETIDIGPAININYYKELALGVGKSYDRWDLGVKLRLLSGMANIDSRRTSLKLTTAEDDYAMTLNTDYEIKTSGTNDPLRNLLLPPKNFENPGVGIDLGAVFHVNDKLEIAQSLIDVGAIKWKRDVVSYKSNGSFTYSGVDLSEFINDDEIYFDDFRDSLKALYFEETKGGSYWSSLVPETYTSLLYKPGRNVDLGALIHLTYFSGVQFGASLYAGKSFSKFLHLGLSYSIKNRRYDNVGFDLSIGPKEFKIFVVTDNLSNFLNLRNGKNVTWRYGINISLGNADDEYQKKPKEDIQPEIPTSTEE